MPNLNRVTLMGHLTADPKFNTTPGGAEVSNIGLALNNTWVDKEGQRQTETTFVDAEAWGKTATTIEQFFSKGDPILIEGRLKQDRWQDKQGQNRSALKVVVERFHFVGPPPQKNVTLAPASPPQRRRQAVNA